MENITETDLVITVVTGTLLMFIMAGVIVFSVIKYQQKVLQQKENLRLAEKKYQNDLLEATIATSEREKENIAKILHDEVGVLLTSVFQNQDRVLKNLNDETLVIELLEANKNSLNEVMRIVKSVQGDLASGALARFGFVKALSQLAGQLNKAYKNDLVFFEDPPEIRFDHKTEVQLLRMCKELLNNILKHSGSTKITINVHMFPETFNIAIYYNGKGINDQTVKALLESDKGLGLKSLYSRAQVLNASLNYFTEEANDACALIRLPVQKENDAFSKN